MPGYDVRLKFHTNYKMAVTKYRFTYSGKEFKSAAPESLGNMDYPWYKR